MRSFAIIIIGCVLASICSHVRAVSDEYKKAYVSRLVGADSRTNHTDTRSIYGFCDYYSTCNTNGYEGACVSISGGCCQGSATPYLCPVSSDIQCCTANPCSTPAGSGTCMSTSQCAAQGGSSVSGYCSGASDLQCCLKTSPPPNPGSYNADAAVSWGNAYCAKDDEWLCAEFVADRKSVV